MNLIKSFNPSYLKENIKKSKGLIVLLLIIVPLLTTLFTVLFVNGKDAIKIASEVEINWINLIGMYIIPLGISFALFGYVYKKNSVDLINSMPLNKQTIFITNTFGGIILIVLMQIITIVLLGICNLICPNLVIFSQMLIDMFIKMFIGYTFIFLATNLAMTISGTFFTQLVVTLLILFLLPFTVMNFKGYLYETNYKIVVDSLDKYNFARVRDIYTSPIQIPIDFVIGNTLSLMSLLKTSLLGAIYFVIGLILFKRRKMENNEESFNNPKMHLLVKALTIFPMIVFINMIDPGEIATIFILAIISIYYFIYDFVVKRKIKLFVSIVALVVTLGTSYLVTLGIEKIEEDVLTPSRKININDIREVSINLNEVATYNSKDYEIDNYFINNEEIIKLLVEEINRRYSYANSKDAPATYSTEMEFKVVYKTKTGKKLYSSLSLSKENFDKLIELLSKDEKYVDYVKNEYKNTARICLDDEVLPRDIENAIKSELEKNVDNMTLAEILNKLIKNDYTYYSNIELISYRNHHYTSRTLNINYSNEISKMIMKYQNELASEIIKNVSRSNFEIRVEGDLYLDVNINANNYYDVRYFHIAAKDAVKFIENNKDIECDPSQNFYQLRVVDYKTRKQSTFYTNKIDEVNELLRKENNYYNYKEDVEVAY